MAPGKKPNDCLLCMLLAKQAASDSDLETLLWAFAGDHAALDPDKVEAVTKRVDGLRRKLLVTYQSGGWYLPMDDVWSNQNLTSRHININLSHYGFISDLQTNARRALKYLDANRRPEPFPFLRLPFEIRQQVYSYMLAGTGRQLNVHGTHSYTRDTNNTIVRRTISPSSQNLDEHQQGQLEIDVAILRACRQIHDEAEPTLYRLHDFAFGDETPYIVEFLEELSPRARENIRCISMTFAAKSKYGGRPDRVEMRNFQHWRCACAYIASELQLHELIFDLDVPSQRSHFDRIECIRALRQITNLKKLTQTRMIRNHTPPRSDRPLLGVRHGTVTAVGKHEWLRDMDDLLLFLVQRMVRPDCFPQDPIRWR